MNLKEKNALDWALEDFIAKQIDFLAPLEIEGLKQAITQLSQDLALGHSCTKIIQAELQFVLQKLIKQGDWVSEQKATPFNYDLAEHQLYFHRYWQYEQQLAEALTQKINAESNYDLKVSEAKINDFFPAQKEGRDDQRQAVEKSLQQNFSIITGGPGTGKTTTVVKALALMLLDNPTWHIALAAPTGKAAMRLQTSIGAGIQNLACDETLKQSIPKEVKTLHRLLGAKYRSPYFKHHADNPLPYDVVVVDEASMIDLALMSKLVAALKYNAKLLLLGDKDQLASVESGAVLADLTQALPNHTHELKYSYRFKGHIKTLADLVNQKSPQAWAFLSENASKHGDIDLFEPLADKIVALALDKWQMFLQYVDAFNGSDEPEVLNLAFAQLVEAFEKFQILCSNRKGILGVEHLNQLITHRFNRGKRQVWYPGRAVMVLENQPAIGLYNGDVGFCLPYQESNQEDCLQVWFSQPDGSIKRFLPSRLPACETCYAMTIHKSQGSEFDEVFICLSDLMPNPVMNKELIYTAITRAKKRATLATNKTLFNQALQQDAQRISGLVKKIMAYKETFA